MREYSFRGKDFKGQWIKFNLFSLNMMRVGRIELGTIGQYTGLKDKNGVEIYEGDIVLVMYKEKRNFNGVKFEGVIRSRETVVYFNEEKAAFELQICIEGVKLYRGLAIGDKVNDVELVSIKVIGNIYDSPELLEVEE